MVFLLRLLPYIDQNFYLGEAFVLTSAWPPPAFSGPGWRLLGWAPVGVRLGSASGISHAARSRSGPHHARSVRRSRGSDW